MPPVRFLKQACDMCLGSGQHRCCSSNRFSENHYRWGSDVTAGHPPNFSISPQTIFMPPASDCVIISPHVRANSQCHTTSQWALTPSSRQRLYSGGAPCGCKKYTKSIDRAKSVIVWVPHTAGRHHIYTQFGFRYDSVQLHSCLSLINLISQYSLGGLTMQLFHIFVI